MGLLDQLQAYIKANTPRATRPVAKPSQVINEGLLNPNKFNAPAANRFKDSAFGLLGVVPGVGDAASAAESADLFNRGENFAGGLAALGALPLVPALGGMIAKRGGDVADALTEAGTVMSNGGLLDAGGDAANIGGVKPIGQQSSMRLYHGGTVKDEFDPNNALNWFAEDKRFADKFSEYSNGKTQEFDVSLSKPIDATKYGDKEFTLKTWKKKLELIGVNTKNIKLNDFAPDYGKYTFYDLFPHAGNNYKESDGLIDALKQAGYDGIKNTETTDGIKSVVYATFGNTAIKHVK